MQNFAWLCTLHHTRRSKLEVNCYSIGRIMDTDKTYYGVTEPILICRIFNTAVVYRFEKHQDKFTSWVITASLHWLIESYRSIVWHVSKPVTRCPSPSQSFPVSFIHRPRDLDIRSLANLEICSSLQQPQVTPSSETFVFDRHRWPQRLQPRSNRKPSFRQSNTLHVNEPSESEASDQQPLRSQHHVRLPLGYRLRLRAYAYARKKWTAHTPARAHFHESWPVDHRRVQDSRADRNPLLSAHCTAILPGNDQRHGQLQIRTVPHHGCNGEWQTG